MLAKVLKYSSIQISGHVINVFITIYTTRLLYVNLDLEEFGLISLLLGLFSIVLFAKGSLNSSFMTFITESIRKEDNEGVFQVISSGLIITFVLSIVIALFGLITPKEFLLSPLNIPEGKLEIAKYSILILIPFVMIQLITVPFRSYLACMEDFITPTIIENIITIFKLISAVFIAKGEGVILYFQFLVLGQLIGGIIVVSVSLSKLKKFNFNANKNLIFRIWNYSKWVFLGSFFYVIKEQSLNLVINKIFGLSGNAAFGIAKQVSNHINSVLEKLKSSMNPLLLKVHESSKIHYDLAKNSALSFLIILIGVLLILTLGDQMLAIWINEVPKDFNRFFTILSCLILIKSLTIGLYSLFQGKQKIKNYELLVNLNGTIPLIVFYFLSIRETTFFLLLILFEIISTIIQLTLATKEINFQAKEYLRLTFTNTYIHTHI